MRFMSCPDNAGLLLKYSELLFIKVNMERMENMRREGPLGLFILKSGALCHNFNNYVVNLNVQNYILHSVHCLLCSVYFCLVYIAGPYKLQGHLRVIVPM